MGMFSGLGTLAGGVLGGFFGGPLGAGIGAGLGAAAGGTYDNNRAASAARKEADWQNAQQLAFWSLNNDYNSPKSVMARLEEAGLNPNLVYQNGGASYQATMPTAAKSSFRYYHDTNPLMFQQLENMEAQNELLKAQKDLTNQNMSLTAFNKGIANMKNHIAHYNEDYARREHEIFKKTGHIPESYSRSTASGELTGLLRDGLMNIILN